MPYKRLRWAAGRGGISMNGANELVYCIIGQHGKRLLRGEGVKGTHNPI